MHDPKKVSKYGVPKYLKISPALTTISTVMGSRNWLIVRMLA